MGKSGQFSISKSRISSCLMIECRMLNGLATFVFRLLVVVALAWSASEPKVTTSDHFTRVLGPETGTFENGAPRLGSISSCSTEWLEGSALVAWLTEWLEASALVALALEDWGVSWMTTVDLQVPHFVEANGCGIESVAPHDPKALTSESFSSPGFVLPVSGAFVGSTSREAILGGKGSRVPKAHSMVAQRSHMTAEVQYRCLHRDTTQEAQFTAVEGNGSQVFAK